MRKYIIETDCVEIPVEAQWYDIVKGVLIFFDENNLTVYAIKDWKAFKCVDEDDPPNDKTADPEPPKDEEDLRLAKWKEKHG